MTQPQFYVVGGAVRDAILGVKPTDIDYLVVGATPEWMLENGYTQVGADFPVFLKNGEEYALARTERKTGAGYHGFETNSDPSVTLEQDLERRDLTVNSMAVELKYWNEFLTLCEKYRTSLEADFLDEYVHNWKDHIFDKVIMMNGGAFKEDPVRVFRAVRMRHTLPKGEGCQFVGDEWDYGARTWKAMEEMVASDDFKELTPERVAQEVLKAAAKCLNIGQFAAFMNDIEALGAMPSVVDGEISWFPELDVDLEKVTREDGVSDREVVAYMMLCMPNTPHKELKQRFKDRRYSNDAINFGHAVYAIHEAYGNNSKCGTNGMMTAEKYLEVVASISRNELNGAVLFLMELELVHQHNLDMILRAHDIQYMTGIESLTTEQQQSLTGRAIGDAIKATRIKLLDEVIAYYLKRAEN
ncbi:Multifunctional CCA protein [compost metagenome]